MLVSVLINNYNYSLFLDCCLKSVLRQTYNNFEVIIYDDGSSDSSLQVLEKYKNQVKIIANKNYSRSPNQNQANAIYQAFLRSSGDVIYLLDSDDMFVDGKLNKIVEVFDANPHITTVQNLMLEVNGNGDCTNSILPVLKDVEDMSKYIIDKQNFFHLFVPTSGLAFRRSFLESILPLKEDDLEYVWPDLRLSVLSVLYGKIHTIKEPLTYYRVHGENDSNVRGTLVGHSKYLEQAYTYFNMEAILKGFPQIQFSREVYLENTYFYMNLDYDKVVSFCSKAQKIVIWGAGEAGQSISHFLLKQGISIEAFMDTNPNRVGEEVMGVKVMLPLVEMGVQYIISPIHAYDYISQQLRSMNLVEDIDFINPYKG